MSIVTLKRKTAAQYNNLSVGQKQFSINGTTRSQGYVGQNIISRSFPRTPMRGNTARGHGGCGGEYYNGTPISPLCAGDFTNDPTQVKKSVLSNEGQLELRFPPRDFTSKKPDDPQNNNTSQEYTRLQGAKVASQIRQFCSKATSTNSPVTFRIIYTYDSGPSPPTEDSYVYADITFSSIHDVVSYNNIINYPVETPYLPTPPWVTNITLYVYDGTSLQTFTDFDGFYFYFMGNNFMGIDSIIGIAFTDNINNYFPPIYGDLNYGNNPLSMYIGSLNGGTYVITNIYPISGSLTPVEPPPTAEQHTCSNPLLTRNNNYQQRSRRCPTFTTKDASLYTSVDASTYTASLQQQTACKDAVKMAQSRSNESCPFGFTVQQQPQNKHDATYYDGVNRNFYLNSVNLLRRCNKP